MMFAVVGLEETTFNNKFFFLREGKRRARRKETPSEPPLGEAAGWFPAKLSTPFSIQLRKKVILVSGGKMPAF